MMEKLSNNYQSYIAKGISEKDASYQAVHDYYKEVAVDLNSLKEQLGIQQDAISNYNLPAKIADKIHTEEDNSTREAVLKNQYFDIHWGVLMNSKMTEKVLKPLEKSDLKEEAKLIEGWEQKREAKLDFYDPIYQLNDFQAQKSAKQLVALSSLSTTFNAIIQDKNIKPGYTESDENGAHDVIVPIIIVDKNGKKRELSTLSGYGTSEYNEQIRTKHDNHTTAQSEFLDYAKNKISDKVHLNTYTYAASAALTQLQTEDDWAASLDYNTRLLSQPIIKEYVREISRQGDSLENAYNPKLKETIINQLIEKYGGDNDLGVTYENLTGILQKNESYPLYKENQVAVIKLFQQLDSIGSEMTKAQGTINHDTKGAGSSLLALIGQRTNRKIIENALHGTKDTPVLTGASAFYQNNAQQTEQGELYDVIHQGAFNIVGEFFPYVQLMPIFEFITQQTNRQNISLDTQKNVFNALKSYIFSHPKLGLWENPEGTRRRLLYGQDEEASLAERVQKAKETWGQKNYLISRLQTNVDPDGLSPSIVSYMASKASSLDDSENTKSWIDLLRSEDPVKKKLGEDLVKYVYITGGNQDANNFVKYVPYSYLLGTDMGIRLNDLAKNIESLVMTENFKTQWFQHNPWAAISLSSDLKELGGLEQYPERFDLPNIQDEVEFNLNDPLNKLIVKVKTPKAVIKTYSEFISYRSTSENKWILYKKDDMIQNSYTRIDTLGNKDTDEYSYSEGSTRRSIIAENRSKAYDNVQGAPRMINGMLSVNNGIIIQQQMQFPNKGDLRDIKKVLSNIATDSEIPNYLRVVSDFLDKTTPLGEQQDALKMWVAGSGPIPPLTLKVINGMPGSSFAAVMNSFSRELTIDRNSITSKTFFAEVINHELIHDRTALMTLMSEDQDYLLRRYGPQNTQIVQDNWELFRKQNPEIEKIVGQLSDVRKQALRRLQLDMQSKGYDYDTILTDILQDRSKNTPYNTLVYAMHSNTEFITHALTSTDVMQYLNKIRFEGEQKSILEKILEIVQTLTAAIGSALGIKVESDSVLARSIQLSLELMTINKIDNRGPELLSHPNNMNGMFTSGALKSTSITSIDKVIGKLEEQRQELIHSLTGRLTKEDKADKQAKIDKIESDITELKNDGDQIMVGEIGKRHLGWVKTILSQDDPSLAQVMTAERVLETWSNLIDLIYGKGNNATGVDSVLAQVHGDAIDLRGRLLEKMEKKIAQVSAGAVRAKDFNSTELRDITTDQMYVRGLSSAAESTVTQYLATYMETTARHVSEEVNRFVKELEKKKVELKKIHGNLDSFYDKFIQSNDSDTAFGWVQRYSQDWYDFRRKLRGIRQGTLKRINESGLPSSETGKAKAEAWRKYWKDINDNAVFADTRILFDDKTGDLKINDKVAAHRAELEKEIGKAATEELINQAHERYLKYLKRKQSHFDNLENEVAAGNMTEDTAAFEMKEFTYRYSPNVFFNNFKSKLGEFRDINTDYYVKMAPRKYKVDKTGTKPKLSETSFYDIKFEKIQQDKQLEEFYTWYGEKLNSITSLLPVHIQDSLAANSLPVVDKSVLMDFYSHLLRNPAYLKTLTREELQKFSASKWEEGLAEREYKQIPIDYINDKKVPLENRSRDLIGILEIFGAMAYHYKNFAEAKDFIDIGEAVLNYHHEARTGGASQQIEIDGRVTTVKDGLKNTLDAFRYTRDYLMFRRARKLEGKLGEMKNKTVKKLMRERYDLEQGMQAGTIDPSEGFKRIEEIQEELDKPENIGRTFYASKISDRFITFNQLKTLSYNPFSAVVNVGFGMLSASIHANGKKDFNRAELWAAYKNMSGSIARWASFDTVESKMAYKMLAIMDRLGIIGDYVDSHYGEFKVRDRKPGWQRRLNPFAMLRSGDYFMKALTTNAMLIHQKVKVTENGEVKEISLLDALDENGEWNVEKYGENKEWSSADVNEQKAWDKFRNRATRVNMIVHGNQDKNSPKFMNKFILGRLLGQFRSSWLPEGWNARFQQEHFDMQLDRDVKGRYRTIWQLGFGNWGRVLLKQVASLIGKVDPYTGVRRSNDQQPLSEVDIENLRRNFAELAFIFGTGALIMMFRSLHEDDDEKKPGIQFAINILLRSQQDMLFYTGPSAFNNITRNVIPAVNVLNDGLKALKSVTRYMTDSEYEADKVWRSIFKAGLPIPQATLYPKLDYMLNKDLGDLTR